MKTFESYLKEGAIDPHKEGGKLAKEILVLINKWKFDKDEKFKKEAEKKLENIKKLKTDLIGGFGKIDPKGTEGVDKKEAIKYLENKLK